MKAKKWIVSLFAAIISFLLVMALTVYIYDPYCYYRIPEDRLIVNNYRFLNAGIAKNADYDTAILGSSMTQNFNMDSFRTKLGMNPIKLTVGAMSIEGMELTYNLVDRIDKAQNVFVCIDLPSLNKEKDALETYATYLYNDSPFDDYKYLFGYETWMRLLPLNIAFNLAESIGINLPSSYACKNIDNIGEWHSNSTYDGEKIKENYINSNTGVSVQNTTGVHERMIRNADKIIKIVCSDDTKNVILFFPPYSALYWSDLMKRGLFDEYMLVKEYIVNKVEEMPYVTVYDFQSMDSTSDLNNYKDITHYSADINEEMVDCFAEKRYLVDSTNISDSIRSQEQIIDIFNKENADWLQ